MSDLQELLQQLINGLSVGSIYALIAVGYTMVYGVLQLINFAHGDVFMVGAMVSLYTATGRLPPTLPVWAHVAIVGALAVALIAMALLGRTRRQIARALLPLGAIYAISFPLLWLASLASRSLALPSWGAALVVLAFSVSVCGMIGFLIERLAYRPLREKPRINSLITAIGLSLLFEYGGQQSEVFGVTPQAFPELIPHITQPLITFAGVQVSRIDAIVLGVTLALMLGLSYIVLRTKAGLALRAVSFRFDTAALMGIDINRIISLTFILGSTLAAAAGLLYAVKYPKIEPLMGLAPGIKAFIAAVFGGIGNIAGAVVGALVLGLIEVMVVGYLPQGSRYKDGIAFFILIAILLVKPSGLFGKHVVEKV